LVGRLRGGVRRVVVWRVSTAAATLERGGLSLSIVAELGVTSTTAPAGAADDGTTSYVGLALVDTTKGCGGGVEGRCADNNKGVGTTGSSSGGRNGDDDVGMALVERTKGGCLDDDDGVCDGTTSAVVVVSVKGVRAWWWSIGEYGSDTATAVTTGSSSSSPNARQENGRT
jgi:hypothetical protein